MAVPEKVVVYGPEARALLFKGAFFLGNAVKSTLGPYGANALLEKGMKVTNDGVTIAREIQLVDPIQQLGARKLQEVASSTNDEAGDGTTTAITIACAILKEADRFLPKEKELGSRTPIQLIQQIEKERIEVTERLEEMAQKVTTEDQLIQVAKVSVEDEELGNLIGHAQWELGPDGYILAEETNERRSSIERVTGIRIDNGFGSSASINNAEKQSLELRDVEILYTNHTIKSLSEITHILQPIIQKGAKDIVVMSRGFTDTAIQECLENVKKGLNIYPLNAPYTDQAEMMRDLQSILGGKFIDKEHTSLDDIQLSEVGHAEMIVAKRHSTVLTGKKDDRTTQRTAERVEELQKKLSGSESEFEKKNIQVRIAQLTNGFSLLKVGANSETERKYKKDKVDDAVNAVRAAMQEGVVPGAGQAFKQIAESMDDGAILKKALLAPYDQIRENAPPGFEAPEWVKDPVKVLRVALEKACSVSATLATTSIAIATAKEKPRYVIEGTQSNAQEEDFD